MKEKKRSEFFNRMKEKKIKGSFEMKFDASLKLPGEIILNLLYFYDYAIFKKIMLFAYKFLCCIVFAHAYRKFLTVFYRF